VIKNKPYTHKVYVFFEDPPYVLVCIVSDKTLYVAFDYIYAHALLYLFTTL